MPGRYADPNRTKYTQFLREEAAEEIGILREHSEKAEDGLTFWKTRTPERREEYLRSALKALLVGSYR